MKFWNHKRQKLGHNPVDTREYTANENSQRSITQLLGSDLKFKGQNLGYLSPIFLEAKFGALTQISEANLGAKPIAQYGSTPRAM